MVHPDKHWVINQFNTVYLIFVLLLLSPKSISTDQTCPRGCSCSKTSGTDDVTSVTCNHAGFSSVPQGIPNTTTNLSLKGTRINILRKHDLRFLNSLELLELNNCNLQEIQPGAFDGLSSLKQISLVRNKLGKILGNTFRNLTSLSSLNLMLNTLTEIHDDAFIGSSITRLQLDNNHGLWKITPSAFRGSSITELSVTFCNISSQSLTSLRSLQTGSLKTLTITDNSQQLIIPDELFKGFKFQELTLERNGIRNRYFLDHVETNILSLSGNPIGPLAFFQFPLLQNVIHMRLAHTGFKIFDSIFFESLPNLVSLDMSNNGIRTIPKEMEVLIRQLTNLRLNGNPLHCNCRMIWLKNYISENPGKISGSWCTTPEEGDIINLNQSVFQCISPFNISSPAFVSVPLHNRMSLSCSASGDPAPKIIWRLISGGSVQVDSADPNAPGSNKGYVFVRNMTEVMYGIYHCIAVNVVGELRSITNVTGAEFDINSDDNQTEKYINSTKSTINTTTTTTITTVNISTLSYKQTKSKTFTPTKVSKLFKPTDAGGVRGGKLKSTPKSHDTKKSHQTTPKYQKNDTQSKRNSKNVSMNNSASVKDVQIISKTPILFIIMSFVYSTFVNFINIVR